MVHATSAESGLTRSGRARLASRTCLVPGSKALPGHIVLSSRGDAEPQTPRGCCMLRPEAPSCLSQDLSYWSRTHPAWTTELASLVPSPLQKGPGVSGKWSTLPLPKRTSIHLCQGWDLPSLLGQALLWCEDLQAYHTKWSSGSVHSQLVTCSWAPSHAVRSCFQ